MNLSIDASSAEPPFEQIRRQVAQGAGDGTLAAGARPPTVRRLATDLGLAANTVAKAYRALESDGVIETHGRNGSFIAAVHMDDAGAAAAAHAYVLATRRLGLSLDEATRLVERSWTS